MLPLVVALLLSASTAPACAFRVVPGGGVTSGVRALHAAASPNVPQLSRRALAPLALGAAVTLREPKEASAAFPNIASIKQADIERLAFAATLSSEFWRRAQRGSANDGTNRGDVGAEWRPPALLFASIQ